mmetsp:Transcript_106729/g.309637  ORF Transcript_106729/g.309637 Transcript_106729/m.309637 type:complete len:150 (+) Transcript_106729:123-572(+)
MAEVTLKTPIHTEPSRVANQGRWTKEEHARFVVAYAKWGRNWRNISEDVGTRIPMQVKSHEQNVSKRARLASKHTGVSWCSFRQSWKAAIGYKGRITELGYYGDEDEAARAYDVEARKLGRKVNFAVGEGEADYGGTGSGSKAAGQSSK